MSVITKKTKFLSNLILLFVFIIVFSVSFFTERIVPISIYENEGYNAIYKGNTNYKRVSLMFNVYENTQNVNKILDILANKNVKATFFVGGCWADDNEETLKRIIDSGCEIGNHGYFHKDHTKLSLLDNKKEISDCNQFIQLAIGIRPVLFAPPSGAYTNDTLAACSALGMKTILWSKDTIDWRDKNASLIYSRATKNVKSGDFILLHPMKETADALEDILKYYKNNNLKTVTVSQNLQKEG